MFQAELLGTLASEIYAPNVMFRLQFRKICLALASFGVNV